MSSQQKEDIIIPGYDWDPVTKRYYRQSPLDPKRRVTDPNSSITSKSNFLKTRLKSHRNAPAQNFLEILNKRQNGLITNNFEHETTSLKWKDLKLTNTEEIDPNLREIYLLKKFDNTLYGVWKTEAGETKITESKFGSVTTVQVSNLWYEINHITDFCECLSPYSRILFVDNGSSSGTGFAMTTSPILNTPLSPIWCCCSNKFSERYALGIVNAVAIADTTRVLFTRKTGKKVHAVQFDEMGNILYTGLSNGFLKVFDRRSSKCKKEVKFCNKGIDETVLLSNENYLICGAFGGMLFKIDTRTFKKVTEYYGHDHSVSKTPFTIDEPNNLLCASGKDNVTRLWSLNGGDPIQTIVPPVQGSNSSCRAALQYEDFKCVVHLYQKSSSHIYQT